MYNTFRDGSFSYQMELWKSPSEICSKSRFKSIQNRYSAQSKTANPMIATKSANLISFPLAAALVDGAEVLVVL
jgi:hypothetical protein